MLGTEQWNWRPLCVWVSPPANAGANTLMVLPCVRLIQPSAPSCEPCFQAEVEILAEIYMIRWEPCMVGVPKPFAQTCRFIRSPVFPAEWVVRHAAALFCLQCVEQKSAAFFGCPCYFFEQM